jgi:hypothetical protein
MDGLFVAAGCNDDISGFEPGNVRAIAKMFRGAIAFN